MNKYAQIALKTVGSFKDGYSIEEVWWDVAKQIFDTKSAQEKGCPKNTFLGLCEEGLVKKIPKGNYTKSVKNKGYAVQALEALKQNDKKSFTPKELWTAINLGDKRHNSQMDVVLALWNNDYINVQFH